MKYKDKIFLNGYFTNNLGDDLFANIIANRYDEEFVMLLDKKYKKSFIGCGNIHFIFYNKFIKILNYIIKCLSKNRFEIQNFLQVLTLSCVVISGSIFQEGKNYKNPLFLYGKGFKILENKSLFFIGCNFGPYKSKEYFNNHIQLFMKCNDVCFRDKYSYNLFAKSCPRIRYAPDIVFSLNDKFFKHVKYYSSSYIVISVIELENRKNLKEFREDYIIKMIEISNHFLRLNKKVVFMSFCETEGDEKMIRNIIAEGKFEQNKEVAFYAYEGDIDEALSIIYYCDFVIATRFHAMILALKFRKNLLPIIYNNKMLETLHDIDYEGMYYLINDIKKVKLENVNSQQVCSNEVIEKLTFESNNHFMYLDKILKVRK